MTGRRLAIIFFAATIVAATGSFFHFRSAKTAAIVKNLAAASQRSVSPVSLPMFFEANQGQTDPSVKFLSRGHGYSLFLTSDEAVLRLRQSAASTQQSASAVIRMRLDGANSAARVSGAELLAGKSNYFIGNDPAKWHKNIPQYARVNYESVYPGVDLTYYGSQGQLEYDFRVAPGADPNQIALTFDGASTRLDAGDLVLATSHGDVRFHAPTIYQPDGHAKKAVAGSFRQLADNKIGFQIGNYDHSRELVIDPSMSYFTYLGGSGTETNAQVAVDSSLNIYLAGTTDSADFPHTIGALTGARNVFVAKLNTTIQLPQSQLVYSTYIGGTGADDTAAVAVDNGGQVFVAGSTTSTNFPTTASNAFQAAPAGPGTHGFLTKLNSTGVPSYSTYLSGTNLSGSTIDLVTGLAIDTRGNAFVTGTTTSKDIATGFPSTPSAYQKLPLADTQFFASKINTLAAGASSMAYSTYFGGVNPPSPTLTGGGIAIDNGGNMYITGTTNSIFDPNADINPNLPRTNFPILNAQQGCLDQAPSVTACDVNQTALDAFAAKINPNRAGTVGLVYSTYLGGSADDGGIGIAVDSAGNAYVTGQTLSGDWTPPTSPTPFQPAFAGGVNLHDAFIAKIGNPTQTSPIYPLTYFTYLGGTGDDIGQAIAVDSVGSAHVTGTTGSPDLPVTPGLPQQSGHGNLTDAFVGQIITSQNGRAAGDYLVYLGGNGTDTGLSIAVDADDAAYVAGETQSSDFPRPTSPPAPAPFQSNLGGGQDAFVARIGAISGFTESAPPTVSPNPASVGNDVTFTYTLVNNGPDPASRVTFLATFTSPGVTFKSATSSPGVCVNVLANIGCDVGSVPVNGTVQITIVLTPLTGTQFVTVINPTLTANGGIPVPVVPNVPAVPVTDFSIGVAPTSVTINAGESTSFVATLSPVANGGAGTYAGTITMQQVGLPSASTGTFTSSTVTIPGTSAVTTTLNVSTTARPVKTGSLLRGGPLYATWLPVGGLSLLGLGVGAGFKRRRWLAGMLLGLLTGLVLLQAACGSSSSSTPPSGGTPAGTYTVTITGSSGAASRNQKVTLIVN